MCRCHERREAIARAVGAVARGDISAIVREASSVVTTSVQDARLAANRLMQTHRRLQR